MNKAQKLRRINTQKDIYTAPLERQIKELQKELERYELASRICEYRIEYGTDLPERKCNLEKMVALIKTYEYLDDASIHHVLVNKTMEELEAELERL